MEDLFPYQAEGVSWLSKMRVALLADEMGLGKTPQAIVASDRIGAKRILVICPAVARINWAREFSRWSIYERPFFIPLGKKDDPGPRQSVICSYDYAATHTERLLKEDWDLLILDESHFLKSLEAKRAKKILGRGGIAHHSKRIWALSGTPAPNHAGELWPLLYTFGVIKLSYNAFIETYCETRPTPYGIQVIGVKKSWIGNLRDLLDSVMLRRKKEDVMKELPPIFFSDVAVEPGEVDLSQESSFFQYIHPIDRTDELKAKLAQEERLVNEMVELTGFTKDGMRGLEAIAQSVSTLRRYTGLQKVGPVAELVKEELDSKAYEKVVLFAIHRDVIEGLRVRLSDYGAVTLYGGTDPERRQKNVDKFQNHPKTRIFIGNIQAAGTAITLTAAHHVIFAEQDWVPGNNAQAAMRCHRIGQTRPVNVRFIGLSGSIDEKIAGVLKRKAKDLTAIFDERVLR